MITKRFQNANLSNSIYQQKGAGIGLSVNDGMLINNRPDSTTGIQKACEIKKAVKVAQKVEVMSKAMSIAKMETNHMDMIYSGPKARY
jgi:hypothetical protein